MRALRGKTRMARLHSSVPALMRAACPAHGRDRMQDQTGAKEADPWQESAAGWTGRRIARPFARSPSVAARVSGGGVRFSGACQPALQRERSGTCQARPYPAVSPEGGRCAYPRMAPPRLQGQPCPARFGERNAARTGGETPLNVLRLRGLSHFLRAPQGGLTRADGGTERPYPPGPPQKPQVRTARTPPFRVPMQGAACFARLFCARKMLAAAVCRRENRAYGRVRPAETQTSVIYGIGVCFWRRSGESRSALRFVLKRSGRIYSGAYYGT